MKTTNAIGADFRDELDRLDDGESLEHAPSGTFWIGIPGGWLVAIGLTAIFVPALPAVER